jgi:hypothetical protein
MYLAYKKDQASWGEVEAFRQVFFKVSPTPLFAIVICYALELLLVNCSYVMLLLISVSVFYCQNNTLAIIKIVISYSVICFKLCAYS